MASRDALGRVLGVSGRCIGSVQGSLGVILGRVWEPLGTFFDTFCDPGRVLERKRAICWMTESGFQPIGVALGEPEAVKAYL